MELKLKNTLELGALLHDIGKAIQKSDNLKKYKIIDEKKFFTHQICGYLFVKDIIDGLDEFQKSCLSAIIDIDLLLDSIRYHHNYNLSTSGLTDDRKNTIKKYIVEADHLSAKERDEERDEVFKSIEERQKKILANPLAEDGGISLNPIKFQYDKFKDLYSSNDSELQIANLLSNLEENLIFIFKYYSKENISFISFYNSISNILRKFLWVIPSDINEKTPKISLYNHLVQTSLITQLKTYDSSKVIFLIIDFKSIQKFIFNLGTSKKSALRMKGKSYLVQLILEDIILKLNEIFEIRVSNIIQNSGGKAIITIGFSDDNVKKLDRFILETSNIIYSKFSGEIILNFTYSIRDFNVINNYSELYRYAEEDDSKTVTTKDAPYKDIIFEQNTFDQININSRLCEYCKANFAETSNSCDKCEFYIKIGKGLKNAQLITFNSNVKQNNLIYYDVKFYNDLDSLKVNKSADSYLVINDALELGSELGQNKNFGNIFVANHAPTKDDEVSDFQEIASQGGYDNLAILKGDLDNLGKLFNSDSEKDNSTSKTKTLSMYISLFFEGVINQIIKDFFEDDIFVEFCGGDDFILIGKWNKILEFYLILISEFKKYNGNNSKITFSSVYKIFKPKDNILAVIEEAEKELSRAKKLDPSKNKFTCNGFVFDNEKAISVISYWKGLDIKNNANEKYKTKLRNIYEILNKDLKVNFNWRTRTSYIINRDPISLNQIFNNIFYSGKNFEKYMSTDIYPKEKNDFEHFLFFLNLIFYSNRT